ncbi:MAG: cobyrinate a,c-diamide synthase [Simplicispira sp.]|nr:cobyrinate a,c-diamide synthase [Simplicispira sp.]
MHSARCPALLVAAPASGQGKTTVVAALARLHARQGRRVRVFKCGPDFLDPHWHQLASGAPVHSLDLWINGAENCAARLHSAAHEADLILIEGVMGLFDGEPSAADLAQRFGVPVLAVVDASAMAGTFGALAHGLRHYQADLPWAGVLANRVAGERHADMLQRGLREPGDWLGALTRVALGAAPSGKPAPLLPERHLGLVAAHELPDALARLDAAADALAATPLGQMNAADWQRWAVDFPPPPAGQPVPALLAGRTVAVARDAAFSFIYSANLDMLAELGAQLCFFSPLAGDALPPCDAVWLPGGYPELHAARLSANQALREGLRAHLDASKPLWAECGGMLALFDTLRLQDGSAQAMWGLLPGTAAMQPRLAALGPRQIDLDGQVLRGHTFHYSTADCSAPVTAHSRRPGAEDADGEPVFAHGSLRASYFRAWFASRSGGGGAVFGSPA